MHIFMFTDDSFLEVSFLEHEEILLCKPHVSRLYNSVYSQPILDCSMSHSRLFKHPKSENDKFKSVSEIVSVFVS